MIQCEELQTTGTARVAVDPIDARTTSGRDRSVIDAEVALDAGGFATPVQSRAAWVRHLGSAEDQQVVARDGDGRVVGSIALTLSPTRALPGHRMVRVESFGDAYATPAGRALLAEATRFATAHGRVLRVTIELECREEPNKAYLRAALQALGYRRVPAERAAEHTVILDLAETEDEIFARFRKSTRQNIRAAAKYGLELVELDRPEYGDRMNELLDMTMSRTGGEAPRMDWAQVLQACGEIPHRLRLVGVFRGPDRSPASLLGFAWGLHHGERAEYHTGASTRLPGESVSLLHPILWDLIRWAKREGATWFDFGGITHRSGDGQDALGGISDFKRGFTKEEIALGEEWILEPSAMKSWLAGAASQAARSVRQLIPA
jgi:hypothetical protein